MIGQLYFPCACARVQPKTCMPAKHAGMHENIALPCLFLCPPFRSKGLHPFRLHVSPRSAYHLAMCLSPLGASIPNRFLRVWPLDFRSYLLEAEHEAPVTAAALAPGGLRVAVGSEDGTLGVLDLGSHRYSTALRSHCGTVNAVVGHPTRWVGVEGLGC